VIGDPRNDENVIIAQLHALFLRFHNRMADILEADPENAGKKLTFAEVQREVQWHYQWMILYDFLPRIIHSSIYNQILPHVNGREADYDRLPLEPKESVQDAPPSLRFYRLDTEPYMPVEFSAAAYRFGHSMVRDEYRLNKNAQPVTGGPFQILSHNTPFDLQGFRRFRDDWAIDWGFFFEGLGIPPENEPPKGEIDLGEQQTQRASQIDTSLAEALKTLPFPFAASVPNLAERNLVRGLRLSLPSGQSVARMFGVDPLSEDELAVADTKLADISPAFRNNAPLWFYILSEAQNWITKAKTVLAEAADKAQNELAKVKIGSLVVTDANRGYAEARSATNEVMTGASEADEALKQVDGAQKARQRMGEARDKFLARQKELKDALKERDNVKSELRNPGKKPLGEAQTMLNVSITRSDGAQTQGVGIEEAQKAVDDAQTSQDEAQTKLAEAQTRKTGVEAAQKELDDAQTELAEAQTELAKAHNELLKPVQERLAKALQGVAEAKEGLVKPRNELAAAQTPLAKFATLGPVGSRIVMETFVGLMWGDEYSFLRQEPGWKPWPVRKDSSKTDFGMTDFIKLAQAEGSPVEQPGKMAAGSA
jgi:hypothetical protein